MKVATLLVAGAWIASASLYAQFAAAQGAQPAAQTQAASSSAEQPSDIVQTAAQGILKDLEANRDAYRKDPSKIATLVDKYLLPHFDTEYAARLVLAQYWRTATPEQKKRFVDAFYHSLLQN
jgi:phospholipid transport system substrate-binding protein